MIEEKEIKAYVEGLASRTSWEWTAGTACLLYGALSLYEGAGWEAGRLAAARAAGRLKKEIGEGMDLGFGAAACARLLFYLEKDRPEGMKDTADRVFAWLSGREWPDKASGCWEQELFLAEPFYLEYENTFHAKEQYNHIQEQLKEAARLAEAGRKEGRFEEGWYLMAMADCCGLISEEVFDHYKNAEGYLKAGISEASAGGPGTAYAVLKGCRLGALLPEKYAEKGRRMLEAAKGLSGDEAGIWLMAYGEYVRLCRGGEGQ